MAGDSPETQTNFETAAPNGKFRVIWVDFESEHDDADLLSIGSTMLSNPCLFIGDFDTVTQALECRKSLEEEGLNVDGEYMLFGDDGAPI